MIPKCERKFHSAYQRCMSDWKKFGIVKELEDEKKSWINPFEEERERGHAILQRRRRLMDIKVAEHPKQEGESQKPPDYKEACTPAESTRQKEIQDLMEAYWASNDLLLSMIDKRSQNLYVRRVDILRNHFDRHGRPYFWVLERAKCADTGGCCGRDCGCCDKALLAYNRPFGYLYPDQKRVFRVYGHCTVECPCCIQVRHRYHPHPRLPKSNF
ncbi:hypothetical protein BDV28DRAFT_161892 [Aspergillus coremiiformis]|uniref:Uncharacterized protein n=1 Tax=Aspergillus coremiiformis TaxID=138285 RepID=A0A5N6Z3P0_9EURO|nr:hypothetical protein BDV28DRAFT_161892 [Aspergillus coremiiformis]